MMEGTSETNREAIEWAVIKSMMDAQSHTTASLEQYILFVTHDEMELDEQSVDACLEQAIENQQRALDDLRAARDLVRKEPHEGK